MNKKPIADQNSVSSPAPSGSNSNVVSNSIAGSNDSNAASAKSAAGASSRAVATQVSTSDKTQAMAGAPDVVLIHGMTEDKKGLKVIRASPEGIEAGEMRPLVEGQPITSDVVRLKPRAGAPYICDVETEFSVNHVARSMGKDSESAIRSGPAQVANHAYRTNWDTIRARSNTGADVDPGKLN